MVPDLNRIHSLAKDLLAFRERLGKEIPEICDFDADLADHVIDVRSSLYILYKDLDQILVDYDC